MRLARTRLRLRAVRGALAMLVAIYRRDRHWRGILGKVWVVATKEGMGGVKSRIVALSRLEAPPLQTFAPPTYGQWIEQFDSLREQNVPAARRHLAMLNLPDVLLTIVVRREDVALLGRVVASWQESIHPGWRAAMIASSDLSRSDLGILQSLAASDSRLSTIATPQEVEALWAQFDYTLLCFGAVLLNRFSIYMFLEAATRTEADIVYADSDRADATGQRFGPAFKPQFSPEYLARDNYIGDCLLLSRSVASTPDACGSLFRLAVADYDRLVARLVLGRRVEHVPFVLFHVLGEIPRAMYDVPAVDDRGPGVAIVVATRNGLAHVKPSIDGILANTSYDLDLVTIVVVDGHSSDPATRASLGANIAVVKYPLPFDLAAMRNFGARETQQDILVFLNDTAVVDDPAWLGKLVQQAKRPDVGVVGAKLLLPDGTVWHRGWVAGGNMGGIGHLPANDDVPTRETTLLSAACCAVRREVFAQVGGFDPILKSVWSDAKFCLDCLRLGLRNVYVADPLLSCGKPDMGEGTDIYFDEADYVRRQYRDIFQDDPAYNPNLSVETARPFAEPPRVRRPWSRLPDRPHRILMLSMVYKIGFGVPLVIQQQARKFKELGYEVTIGGPKAEREFDFPGCERVILGSAKEAAIFAFDSDVSLIVAHTPPYFEMPLSIGGHIPVLAYEYGEPSASFFPDPVRTYLMNVENQKRSAAAMTTAIATISQAVKDETLNNGAIVVGLANSHLPAWSETLRPRRDSVRERLGWGNRFVVLTVCRFSENERAYKGLDKIALILRKFPYLHPDRSANLVWALAGAGSASDVEQVEALGFTVFPNVSDDVLIDLYTAADAYMGFSRWEGYNLGIGQALAMGLPTVASDIPAHREFPIFTSNSILAVCNWLAGEVAAETASKPDRRAMVYEWEDSTTRFADLVAQVLRDAAEQKPRLGASGGLLRQRQSAPLGGLPDQ